MKKIVKQAVGIDVAQKELVVSLGKMYDDWTLEVYAHKTFRNTEKGFIALVTWVKKLSDAEVSVRYVMEATGVYHECLAYFLDEKNYELTIVLPNKISSFMKTLDLKTVTDKTAAEAIVRFGLERKLETWKRPQTVFKKLKQLTREREQIIQDRTGTKNQLHAEKAEAEPNDSSIKRMKKRILILSTQEKEIREEITELLKQDAQLEKSVELLCTLPGVAHLTAVTVLGETNAFELIRNKKQLTSYAGLDVKEKLSGTSVKGKPRISKRGNRYLRKVLHFPALAAIRTDDRFKSVFVRLVSKHGLKMKAAVAVQRKLLEMMYTLFKNNVPYDQNYLQKENQEKCVALN
jgi:transposase